jgi:5-amino-6-(5-phospho-D-ribitylamino)uracil phosphatase
MNKRHLIAIDVDGTLLNEEGLLSAKTIEVLHKRQEQGDVIILASGRPWRSLSPIYGEIGLTSPVICYNGALIFDPKKPSFPRLDRRFRKEDIKDIVRKAKPFLLSVMCESEEKAYLDKEDDYLKKYFPYDGIAIEKGSLLDTLDEDPYTAIFHASDKTNEQLRSLVESHEPLRYRHWRGVPYSEAFYAGTDKGSALLYLMAELGFKREDVIAFGDSDNDYQMLEASGHPFAMEGGRSPLLLKEFPHTKKGNDHDGVALALEEFVD